VADRSDDWDRIRTQIAPKVVDETDRSLVVHGDSLEVLRDFPDASVSLILCDPPYHSTKKGNIYGDRAFQEDEHFLEWMNQYGAEWKRVLKPNGTLYVFCSSIMSARLEVTIGQHVRPISHITWTKPNDPGYDGWKGKMSKEALRQWYPHSERILVFEQGAYGTHEAYRRSLMGQYLQEMRFKAGLSGHKLTDLIGAYGKVNHGGAVANWEAGRNIPSRAQYAKLRAVLEATGRVTVLVDYEDLVRPMNLSSEVEFTDVWTFMSVRPFKDKHPAEKPQDLLMHAIEASTYDDDIVVDCFAGSGSTGVAALRLGRRTICIETEERWVKRAAADLADVVAGQNCGSDLRPRGRTGRPSAVERLFD